MPLSPHHLKALRRRKLFRRTALAIIALLGLVILLDHLGCFGYHGNDLLRFDAQQFKVIGIDPRGDLTLETLEMKVRLLGIASDRAATEYLTLLVKGNRVILKLESPQTRDAEGRLLAYVYLNVADCVNVDLVKAGCARVDRGRPCSMRALLDRAEADARKHRRGLWGVTRPADELKSE